MSTKGLKLFHCKECGRMRYCRTTVGEWWCSKGHKVHTPTFVTVDWAVRDTVEQMKTSLTMTGLFNRSYK
jgi:ribosomal protein L37AE/L43A